MFKDTPLGKYVKVVFKETSESEPQVFNGTLSFFNRSFAVLKDDKNHVHFIATDAIIRLSDRT